LESSSDAVRVSFLRTGGIFAGNRLELALNEDELSPDEAAAWTVASEAGALERQPAVRSGPGMAADEYQYDLTIRRGDEEQAVRFTDSNLPPELAPLVRLLEQRAEDELRRQVGR
jgi:hypothetical protein